jgi:hypothetical protein
MLWKWILQLPPLSVTEYFTSRVSQQLDSRDTDNLSPSTPKSRTEPGNQKKNSSRCSIFGNNGKIDSLSDSDDFGEEVIYSHESPKMEEFIRDFDWDLNRFVEYRSPFTKKH